MNQIQKELQAAQTCMLETVSVPCSDEQLVKLTFDNVAIVEAMIQNDSAYLKSSNKNAAPKSKPKGGVTYGGSTAYWMTQLKPILLGEKAVGDQEYRDLIKGAIFAVDRENSTHLNADKVGREEIADRIIDIDKAVLIDYLKHPDATQLKLVHLISQKTHAIVKARKNQSFASKFCHYACFYLFEGEAEQDNYSIYDNILKNVLPKYVSYYGLSERKLNDYVVYRKTVDEIIRKSQSGISRNGFDHLLWYYFKGRI